MGNELGYKLGNKLGNDLGNELDNELVDELTDHPEKRYSPVARIAACFVRSAAAAHSFRDHEKSSHLSASSGWLSVLRRGSSGEGGRAALKCSYLLRRMGMSAESSRSPDRRESRFIIAVVLVV